LTILGAHWVGFAAPTPTTITNTEAILTPTILERNLVNSDSELVLYQLVPQGYNTAQCMVDLHVHCRHDLGAMLNEWVDPHNGGKYSLFTNTSTSVTGMRLTGSNGPAEPYVDHWDITFTPVGRDPTKCEVGQRASPSCSPVTSPSFIHPSPVTIPFASR
jgi:hypothetical protein